MAGAVWNVDGCHVFELLTDLRNTAQDRVNV